MEGGRDGQKVEMFAQDWGEYLLSLGGGKGIAGQKPNPRGSFLEDRI